MATFMLVAAACGGGDDVATQAPTTTSADGTATTTTAGTDATTAAPDTTTAAPDTTTTAVTGTESSLAVLREALAQNTGETSARMAGSLELSGAADMDGTFTILFEGAFKDSTTFSFTMDMSSILDALPEDEQIPPEFAGMFSDIEIRQIDDVVYTRFPFFSLFLGVQTEWISTSATEGSAADAFASSPANPSEIFDSLEGADAEVSEIGRETVRDVETTHYRAVFDIEGLKESLSPEELAQLEDDLPAGAFPNGLPMEFWIGDDGRVYRFVMDIAGDDVEFTSDDEAFSRMVMTYEIFDYGVDVVVEAPPADQVTDGGDLGGLIDF